MSIRQQSWPVTREIWRRFHDHQGSVLAGHLAFSAMLAFMPFMIFAAALAAFVIGPEGAEAAVEAVFRAVPDHVAQTLDPVLHEVLGTRRPGVLTISGLATLWAASNGIDALRIGLDTAYGVGRSRHVVLNRLIAIAMVLLGLLVFAVLAALLVFAPLVFRMVETLTTIRIPEEAELLRYGLGLLFLWVSLWGVHRFLPSWQMPGRVLWPGILVSLILWLVATEAVSIWLAASPTYALTYGALSGVMVTLVFFYALGAAVLVGAEFNAVLHRRRIAAP